MGDSQINQNDEQYWVVVGGVTILILAVLPSYFVYMHSMLQTRGTQAMSFGHLIQMLWLCRLVGLEDQLANVINVTTGKKDQQRMFDIYQVATLLPPSSNQAVTLASMLWQVLNDCRVKANITLYKKILFLTVKQNITNYSPKCINFLSDLQV